MINFIKNMIGAKNRTDDGRKWYRFGTSEGYPCVPCYREPPTDTWVEYGAAKAHPANAGDTLTVGRRYRAVCYGAVGDDMVWEVDGLDLSPITLTSDSDSDSDSDSSGSSGGPDTPPNPYANPIVTTQILGSEGCGLVYRQSTYTPVFSRAGLFLGFELTDAGDYWQSLEGCCHCDDDSSSSSDSDSDSGSDSSSEGGPTDDSPSGTSCSDAPLISVGTTYLGTIPVDSGASANRWVGFDLPSAGTYHITVTVDVVIGDGVTNPPYYGAENINLFTGECGGTTIVGGVTLTTQMRTGLTGCQTVTVGAATKLWHSFYTVNRDFAVDDGYTLLVEAGSC